MACLICYGTASTREHFVYFWSQIAIAALLMWIREDQASDEAIDFAFGLEACNGSLYIGL